MIQYSVILPQRESVAMLRRVLPLWYETLEQLGQTYEIIVVDDASPLRVRKQLAELLDDFYDLRILRLSRRCGPSAALNAAVAAARGRTLISWEVALRFPPSEVTNLLKRLSRADMVYGRPTRSRWGRWWQKVLLLPRRGLLGSQILDGNCPCWVAYREALAGLHLLAHQYRYLPWLVDMRGFRVANAPMAMGSAAGSTFYDHWPHVLDLFCVWWLRRRWQQYAVQEFEPSQLSLLPGLSSRIDPPHRRRPSERRSSHETPDEDSAR